MKPGYVCTLIGSVIGGLLLAFSFAGSSAPQQAAGAAMAAACGILPYVFSRALTELRQPRKASQPLTVADLPVHLQQQIVAQQQQQQPSQATGT